MKKAHKSLFDNNKSQKVLFVTSDGMPFWNKHRAINHANGLKDREIDVIDRKGNESKLSPTGEIDPEAIENANAGYGPDLTPPPTKGVEEMSLDELKAWTEEQEDPATILAALELVEIDGASDILDARFEELNAEE